MIEFILKSQNFPFTVSLTIMLLIAFLEGVSTFLGSGLSHLIDSIIPDIDMDVDIDADVDIDVDADIDSPEIVHAGVLSKTLGWFRLGKVPFLIILIIFLTSFGIIGLTIQTTLFKITGLILPGLVASAISLPITLPIVRLLTGIIAKIIPKDETDAVSEKSFIGRMAIITLGKASFGSPAQAKLKDQFGTTHYLMIEPDVKDLEFKQGDQVLIVKQTSSGFKAIRNENSALLNTD